MSAERPRLKIFGYETFIPLPKNNRRWKVGFGVGASLALLLAVA